MKPPHLMVVIMLFAFNACKKSSDPMEAASDLAIQRQAALCDIKPDQLKWIRDGSGQRKALITPDGDLERLPFKSVGCLLYWAQKTGHRVGFISEPFPKVSTGS